MYDYDYDFSAYSALFNVVDNSIFIRDRLANQVNYIYADKNKENIKIHNIDRLKKILFKEIQKDYNSRIIHYGLNLPLLDEDIDKEKLEIVNFLLSDSSSTIKRTSGRYHVYPRVFRCKKCGDYKALTREEWEKFNPNKCPHCGDEYTQISMLAFCEECGIIETVSKSCPQCHNTKNLKLNIVEEESPSTWRFICPECGKEFDFMPYPCNHTEPFTKNNLSDADPTKFTLINVRRGGLFKSCVKTTVDVPENKKSENDSDFIDEIIIGNYFNKWNHLGLTQGDEVTDVKRLLKMLQMYPTEQDRKEAIFVSPQAFEVGETILSMLKKIREDFDNDTTLSDVADYLILKENVLQDEDSLNISLNENFRNYYNLSEEEYSEFLNDFGIEDVTYLPNIQLISSSYGYIRGMNKFYEDDFVPHFEPHWRGGDEGIFKAYAYPYETEGMMFDLDKVKLANWIVTNFAPENRLFVLEEDARNYLYSLKENSDEYHALKTLIHTFSHLLIKRSSLYTGLNEDSCGELLFPKTGAFMIYSTSNINIGGFLFVFENSIMNWFNDIRWDTEECIFDPICMEEGGACFSCMHLPEFVCCNFNKELDRDVFVGKNNRIKEGFWNR